MLTHALYFPNPNTTQCKHKKKGFNVLNEISFEHGDIIIRCTRALKVQRIDSIVIDDDGVMEA